MAGMDCRPSTWLDGSWSTIMMETSPVSLQAGIDRLASPDEAVAVERLLTYREAAAFLGVSQRTVWTLVHEGLLHAVQVGRSIRVTPSDLRAFIARSRFIAGNKGSAA
jgi:excisionase family DNA binding protein